MTQANGRLDYRERQRLLRRFRHEYTHCPICGCELMWDVRTYVDPRDGRRKPHPRSVEIDHKRAFSRGGTNDLDNLQPVCRKCNLKKGDGTHGSSEPKVREPIDVTGDWL